MLDISSTNIEKYRRKSKKGPIFVLSWLVLSSLIVVTVRHEFNINYSKLHSNAIQMSEKQHLRLNGLQEISVPLVIFKSRREQFKFVLNYWFCDSKTFIRTWYMKSTQK